MAMARSPPSICYWNFGKTKKPLSCNSTAFHRTEFCTDSAPIVSSKGEKINEKTKL